MDIQMYLLFYNISHIHHIIVKSEMYFLNMFLQVMKLEQISKLPKTQKHIKGI